MAAHLFMLELSMKANRLIGRFLLFMYRVINRISIAIYKPLFRSCGSNVYFFPSHDFSYSTISIGDDVFIGRYALFQATVCSITIGNKVMFGPRVTIMGGDHNTDCVGRYMYDVKEKLPRNDLPVVIEDDVWIGCNVTILKGVTIGRGSIVAAGAVVNKNVQPYSIVGGNPAVIIKQRWSPEVISEHEKLLYPS